MRSANLASICCSFHICVTDSRVYLNGGTQRTLVNVKRISVPSVVLVITGIEPMHVARTTRPSAPPKTSSQGCLSTSRLQSLVRVAVAPESGVAPKTGRPVADDLKTAALETLARAAWLLLGDHWPSRSLGYQLPRNGSATEVIAEAAGGDAPALLVASARDGQ